MKYKPGQWLFLNCPDVSYHQWHPFTITSCPNDPYISVHVRQVGDFTRALADALGAGQSQSKLYDELDPMGMYEIALQHGQSMPSLKIDGPYGAPAEDVFENEVAVLIGTGIGVTPWASILKSIYHLRLTRPSASVASSSFGSAKTRLRSSGSRRCFRHSKRNPSAAPTATSSCASTHI
jgi:NADPH oxidase